MDYAPLARIVLRYLVGAGVMGSGAIGDTLAADPDLVLYVSLAIGAAVEGGYALAKRRGWKT
jgi:preprotein translocase subunit Sec61beta